MNALQLYDPARRPPNWIDLVAPHQFVAFGSDADSGAPVDEHGLAFPSPDETTCLVFDSLSDARRFCADRVAQHESVRFEIFDARGRVDEPLLLIVSAARAAALDGSKRMTRLRTWIAAALFALAPPLIYYDYAASGGSMVLPTFLGLSMILSGLRLLFMNSGVRDAERRREKRLKQYE